MRTTTLRKAAMVAVIIATAFDSYMGITGHPFFLAMVIADVPLLGVVLWFLVFRRKPREVPPL